MSFFYRFFPTTQSHKLNRVDYFGASGSGLAHYTTMTTRVSKDKNGFSPEPLADIVNRYQQIYLDGDLITFGAYQIAGITVKVQNLVRFFLGKFFLKSA
jgi:hypothetical protein